MVKQIREILSGQNQTHGQDDRWTEGQMDSNTNLPYLPYWVGVGGGYKMHNRHMHITRHTNTTHAHKHIHYTHRHTKVETQTDTHTVSTDPGQGSEL